MSLYIRWPLRNFNTFHHLVDSYRNTISKWAVGFRYQNFTSKLAHGNKSLASCGLIFVGEDISIPETQPIQKSYISLWIPIKSVAKPINNFFYNLQEKRKLMDLKILEDHQSSFQPLLSPVLSYKKDRVVTWRQDSLQLKIQISKLSGSRMVNHCLLDTDSGTFF